VKAIELLPRHGVDYTEDCVFGIKVARQIHIDASMLELWFVGDAYRSMIGVELSIGVGIE
jgi:hypothetical protein